jgi:multidrug efflux pump subunit AcrB
MHRSGLRTLTIESETTGGVLASELLKEIRPEIESLPLPAGYRMEYGGEHANKMEVSGVMATALGVSLILIFLVLLFQFRNMKEVGLVMITIPLSLFGAILGLIITGNDFGFTAFVGLISLSGIVVRNAIILIDHANELFENGMDIRTAAIEAGKRRLRPIFLTAMAAAIGVWPMILSGSPLWSPLASVIAFGVVWAMVISTLAIPVLYLSVIKPGDKKNATEPEKK